MRAKISLLVPSLLLGLLAFDHYAAASDISKSASTSPQQITLAKQNNNPKPQFPYRGSGRKEVMIQ